MDRLAGLPNDVAGALRVAPAEEKAQLELALQWTDLEGAPARVAERVRVRVLTWDPLGWMGERAAGLAAAVQGSGSGYSITLFVGAWALDHPVTGTVAGDLGALATSIVKVGAVNEAHLVSGDYADLAGENLAAPLLGAVALDDTAAAPAVALVAGWRPIDEPTVLLVVEAELGSIDVDLTPRPLSAPDAPAPGCPACRGDAFSVPFALGHARPAMCPPHRAEALAEMARVTLQAERANPDGWEAFCHAAADLLPAPHIPYPIRDRYLDSVEGPSEAHTPELLGEQAEALLALLDWARTPERLAAGMWDLGWRPMDGGSQDNPEFEDEAHDVAYRLGSAGEFDLAARVVDALVPVMPDSAANLHGELAAQLAEAGHLDAARERIAAALADPSADLMTEIYAGEVSAAGGELDEAERRYRAALARARRDGDSMFENDLLWHLVELLQDDDDRADEVVELVAARDRAHARQYEPAEPVTFRSSDVPFGRKVGRNEPCPCGSGKKFKQCHGRS
ncbi:MAG TPA: SEC-C domain-containing protein [Acidimicrobiales bacterium]|nr:SEC-C domain-containing protein [Acidimicrobiales bacterium]